MKKTPFVSVVMPCLNEEATIGVCVEKAYRGLKKAGYKGEVIVCDNGSFDNSVALAKKAGARVVFEQTKGYGSAYMGGLKAARGDWLVMGDSDNTYDFLEIPRLLRLLERGNDLAIGSRLRGRIKKGSMPWLNRYLGTPILNLFLRLFYGLKISDSQSGMRVFTREAFRKMKLRTLGMEFASEMLVRAIQEGLKIAEVPISYSSRAAPPKLSRFRDAWRHLRFMLLFAPTYLFLIPGGLLMALGLLGVFLLVRGPFWLLGRGFDVHSMILASLLTLLGYQIAMLGVYAKVFSWKDGLERGSLLILTVLRYFQLEKGIFLGLVISLSGFLVGLTTFFDWARHGFGALSAVRPLIFSMTLLVLGIQIVFSSFFLSVLGIEKKK